MSSGSSCDGVLFPAAMLTELQFSDRTTARLLRFRTCCRFYYAVCLVPVSVRHRVCMHYNRLSPELETDSGIKARNQWPRYSLSQARSSPSRDPTCLV